MQIAILTPTFNRASLLLRIYASLCAQTDLKFLWIISDDGSTDNTENLVYQFKNEKKLNIEYLKQKNGGKARALNYVFSMIHNIDFFAIVDSDDFLESNGVANIKKEALHFFKNQTIGAIFFRYYIYNKDELIGSTITYKKDTLLGRSEHDKIYPKFDGCIGYFNRAIKKYKFPTYANEKYIAPTLLQMIMEKEFKIAFTNIAIGYAEYQEDGITRAGRKLRLKNPLGMIHYCGYQQKTTKILVRFKYYVCAEAYVYFAKKQKKYIPHNLLSCLNIYAKPFGFFLALYWMLKYERSI